MRNEEGISNRGFSSKHGARDINLIFGTTYAAHRLH